MAGVDPRVGELAVQDLDWQLQSAREISVTTHESLIRKGGIHRTGVNPRVLGKSKSWLPDRKLWCRGQIQKTRYIDGRAICEQV